MDEMIDAIIREMELRSDFLSNQHLQSVYLGGGTPSLLTEDQLTRLFRAIIHHFALSEDPEVTLEANPDDLSYQKLEALGRSPVNRLSIGVQSLDNQLLKFMNRAHTAEDVTRVINEVKEVGFDQVSIDLMYGVPGQDTKDWLDQLERVFNWEVSHLSCYALTLEPKTALAAQIEKKQVQMPDDGEVAEQFTELITAACRNGYEHYEISNFAKDQQYARHNTNYWLGKPYLGLGPSSHSFDGNARSWNPANNSHYIKALQSNEIRQEREILTPIQRYNEYVMVRLRTKWGCEKEELLFLGDAFASHFEHAVQSFLSDRWVIEENDTYRLTPEGRLFADRIASALFFP